jgi:hypothetical protein
MEIGIQEITLGLLTLWFVVFVAGKIQQNRIKKKLLQRIREGVKPLQKENPDLNLDEAYAWVFSNWNSLVRKNAWFVLNKSELFPVAIHPERLRSQMNLTKPWLGAYLTLHGVDLSMSEAQKAAVTEIIQAIPPEKRQVLQEE